MAQARNVRQILIINLHSARNAGDAALLEMAVRVLQPAFPEARFTLAMNEPLPYFGETDCIRVLPSFMAYCRTSQHRWRPAAFVGLAVSLVAAGSARFGHRVPRWLPEGLKELILAYMTADLVVSCPGNIFATVGHFGLPLLLSAFTVFYALLLRKPFYVLPQSIGPFRRGWERELTRRLYSAARIVYVREPVSLKIAQEIGLPVERLKLVPDLAFALPAGPARDAEALLIQHGVTASGPRLGVTAINRLLKNVSVETWCQYEDALALTLTHFIERYGGTVIFCPQVTGPTDREDDRQAAHRIVEKMGHPPQAVLIDEPLPPSQLKALYGQLDLFLGTRMHSIIFAVGMAVPVIAIAYLTKTQGLAQMLDLQAWTIPLAEVTEGKLWPMLETLWQRRAELRAHLIRYQADLSDQANGVGELIARDFDAR
jgi:colanic acid/amylovoran biosynthesis protein